MDHILLYKTLILYCYSDGLWGGLTPPHVLQESTYYYPSLPELYMKDVNNNDIKGASWLGCWRTKMMKSQ